MRRIEIVLVLIVPLALLLPGCATRKYVAAEVEVAEARSIERITEVETQVEQLQERVAEHQEMLDELSLTTREAYERAVAAGKLAEGKFLFETVLSGPGVGFGFDEKSLNEKAKSELDQFAAELSERNQNVYVEIQGHTDATGSDNYNLELGTRRSEAVRRYLSTKHQLPLHRMSVVSYGETAPIAANDTREGRGANRRVTLVVLM